MKKIYGIMGKAGAGKDTAANMMIRMIGKSGGGNVYRYSFADPLKEMCAYVFDIPIKCMYDQELKELEVAINTKNALTLKRMEEWVIKHIQERDKFCHVMIHPKFGFGNFERSQQVAFYLLKTLEKVLLKDESDSDTIEGHTFIITVRYLLQVMGTEVIRDHIHDHFWSEIKKTFPDNSVVVIPDCRFQNEVDYILDRNGKICLVDNPELVRDDLNNHVSERFVNVVEDYLLEKCLPIFHFTNNRSGNYQDLDDQVFKFLKQDGILYMVTITLKYTDYGHKETAEFRQYVQNLVGYLDYHSYYVMFGRESDPMFDDKIVASIQLEDEDHAFDVVLHYMMEREVNGASVPFDVDLPSIAIYVTGSDKIMNYLTSRSFSHLYERLEINESMMNAVMKKNAELESTVQQMSGFMQNIGVDKFPDIVRQLIASMEAEGHSCEQNIKEILKRKTH